MKSLIAIVPALALGACTATTVGTLYTRNPPVEQPRDVFIAIDGTGESPITRTNAARLFEHVDAYAASRPHAGTATYYAEGVGSRGNPLGLMAGNGMAEDIEGAYEFLTRTWRPHDRIYLAGFSRGAYAVRALGGLVAIAGIPNLSGRSIEDRERIVEAILDAYRAGRDGEAVAARNQRRRNRLQAVFDRFGLGPLPEPFEVRIEAMALWDTIEALGLPKRTDHPTASVPDYFLTNCNVGRVFHVLALDDNRAEYFTPIFAAGPAMVEACPQGPHATVEEVWFAGAHSDVSGSYAPGGRMDGFLPGVSLNWMFDRLWETGLFDPAARAFEDRRGPVHDAQAFQPYYRVFPRKRRDPFAYHQAAGVPGVPKVHISAFERLLAVGEADAASRRCPNGIEPPGEPRLLCRDDLRGEGFVAAMLGRGCLLETPAGFQLRRGQRCISVVCDDGRFDDFYCGKPSALAAVRSELELAESAAPD